MKKAFFYLLFIALCGVHHVISIHPPCPENVVKLDLEDGDSKICSFPGSKNDVPSLLAVHRLFMIHFSKTDNVILPDGLRLDDNDKHLYNPLDQYCHFFGNPQANCRKVDIERLNPENCNYSLSANWPPVLNISAKSKLIFRMEYTFLPCNEKNSTQRTEESPSDGCCSMNRILIAAVVVLSVLLLMAAAGLLLANRSKIHQKSLKNESEKDVYSFADAVGSKQPRPDQTGLNQTVYNELQR